MDHDTFTIRGWCALCNRRHDDPPPRVAHPSTTGCRTHGIQRCTICHPTLTLADGPIWCPCECNSGGFCGGCGHAGCGARR